MMPAWQVLVCYRHITGTVVEDKQYVHSTLQSYDWVQSQKGIYFISHTKCLSFKETALSA